MYKKTTYKFLIEFFTKDYLQMYKTLQVVFSYNMFIVQPHCSHTKTTIIAIRKMKLQPQKPHYYRCNALLHTHTTRLDGQNGGSVKCPADNKARRHFLSLDCFRSKEFFNKKNIFFSGNFVEK